MDRVGRVRGWFNGAERQLVSFGTAIEASLPQALARIDAHRVLLVTTRSLAGPAGLAYRVAALLGDRLVAMLANVRAHSPVGDVIDIAARLSTVDVVVTLGGGSVCDAVKAARLCHASGIHDLAGLESILASDGTFHAPKVPHIAIPTTLSAAEFTARAGITNEEATRKRSISHVGLAPDMVLLDPSFTLATPQALWLSTGMRAVDHAIETWCASYPTPFSDACSLQASRLLIPALRRSRADTGDLMARRDCMAGSWLSILGAASGVQLGASHGIGHALGGTANMPHGLTSCVMLPHVLRYNAAVNVDRQRQLVRALGLEGDPPLADVVAGLVSDLGLTHRLRDAGIARHQLKFIAAASLLDPLLAENPPPIDDAAIIERLLESAW